MPERDDPVPTAERALTRLLQALPGVGGMAGQEKCAHLLRRAGFGPTAEEVDAAEKAGCRAHRAEVPKPSPDLRRVSFPAGTGRSQERRSADLPRHPAQLTLMVSMRSGSDRGPPGHLHLRRRDRRLRDVKSAGPRLSRGPAGTFNSWPGLETGSGNDRRCCCRSHCLRIGFGFGLGFVFAGFDS